MKRVIGLVFFCGAASCLCAAAAPLTKVSVSATGAKPKMTEAQKEAAQAAAIALLAPADEYFGPLKQSVIGINNTIRDLGWNYDVNHDIGDKTVASAALTSRAIRDWESKYPKDDQLPHALYLLQRLYTKILTQGSRDLSKSTAQWLFKDFGKSPQAKALRKTLASEHLPPIPTPSPSPTPTFESIFGPAYPTQFSETPAPTETPSPTTIETPPLAASPSPPAH